MKTEVRKSTKYWLKISASAECTGEKADKYVPEGNPRVVLASFHIFLKELLNIVKIFIFHNFRLFVLNSPRYPTFQGLRNCVQDRLIIPARDGASGREVGRAERGKESRAGFGSSIEIMSRESLPQGGPPLHPPFRCLSLNL